MKDEKRILVLLFLFFVNRIPIIIGKKKLDFCD